MEEGIYMSHQHNGQVFVGYSTLKLACSLTPDETPGLSCEVGNYNSLFVILL